MAKSGKNHNITELCVDTVWVKKVDPKKTFYSIFSLGETVLVPKYIPVSKPILVRLSEYLCEMFSFYQQDPSNFKNSIQFVMKFVNFSQKNTSHII